MLQATEAPQRARAGLQVGAGPDGNDAGRLGVLPAGGIERPISSTSTTGDPSRVRTPARTWHAASGVPNPVAPDGARAATTLSARLATASPGDATPSQMRAFASS